jgi:hypothetical protein
LRTIEDPAIDKLLNGANETNGQGPAQESLGPGGSLINESAPAIFLYKQPVLYGLSSRMDWKPRSDEFLYIYDAKLR